jgi:hypothetical protein
MIKYYMSTEHFERSFVKCNKFLRKKLGDIFLGDILSDFFPVLC